MWPQPHRASLPPAREVLRELDGSPEDAVRSRLGLVAGDGEEGEPALLLAWLQPEAELDSGVRAQQTPVFAHHLAVGPRIAADQSQGPADGGIARGDPAIGGHADRALRAQQAA